MSATNARTTPFRRLATAAVAVLAVLGMAACSGGAGSSSSSGSQVGDRSPEQIKEAGEIVIGIFSDKAPFGYIDANGKPAGYDVVYGDRIAADLGVTAKYVPVDAAARTEVLASNKVDITLSQLAGKTLIVTKGTTAEAYFEANHPEIKLQKYDQYSDAYQALEDGRGDAFSTDNTEVIAWAIQHPGFSVGIKSLGDTSYIAAAVKKGNTALLDWLNNELVDLGQENFFHKDYEQTLAPVYGDAATADDLVVEGGVDTTSTN